MSIVGELQVLIDTTLKGDAQLSAMITEVYSQRAPDGAQFPYIVLGASTEGELNSFGKTGTNGTEQINGYSQHRDKLEAAEMYQHVHRLLHRQRFTLAGGEIVHTRVSLLALDEDVGGNARFVAIMRALNRG